LNRHLARRARWSGAGVPALAVLGLAGFGGVGATAHAQDAAVCEASTGHLDSAYVAWVGLRLRSSGLSEDELLRDADALVSRTFAPEAMAKRIFGGDWKKLGDYRRGRFLTALRRGLALRTLEELEEVSEPPHLTAVDQEIRRDGEIVRLPYLLVGGAGGSRSVWVAERPEGFCRIVDLRGGGGELIKDLRKRVKKTRDDYSFEQMVAEVGRYEYVVLDDFEAYPVGELPPGWTWRGGDKDKNKPYRVVREADNSFLQATDRGESVILGRKVHWNLNEYPYVSFRVRVWRVPEGGNERYDDLVDSAAGVYFTLRKKFLGKIPESVKYVWSSTLPVGAAVRREGIGKPWQVVFGSGTDGIGEWRTYTFDVRQAYRDTFGGKPPKKAEGIGVLSDANSLHLEAFADYDDFRALRTAPPGVTSGVDEILPPLGRSTGGN
jgi:Protein of unknown function (DUF3047)